MFRVIALSVIAAAVSLCTPELVLAKQRHSLTPLELKALCAMTAQLGVTSVAARDAYMPSSTLVRLSPTEKNYDPALLSMNTTIITYVYDHKHVSAFDAMKYSEQLCLRTFGGAQ